jgi:hypothetical protein
MGFQAFNISMCRVVTKIAGYRFNSTLFLFFFFAGNKGGLTPPKRKRKKENITTASEASYSYTIC